MNKNDRRVRKTKKALQEALAKLLAEKDLRQITIRELTETADIHRATFYAHYQDVYDLYEQLEKSILSELNDIIDDGIINSYKVVYKAVIDYVYDHAEVMKMFFSTKSNNTLRNSICELIEKKYLNIWLFQSNRTEISDEMRYLTTYNIQGCIAIIILWINSGFSYPKEKVAELIQKVNDNVEQIMD